MTDSVILNSPIILILYGVALVILIVGLIWRKTGFIMPVLSAALAVCASAYAVISGAALFEVATVIMIFLAVNLFTVDWRRK